MTKYERLILVRLREIVIEYCRAGCSQIEELWASIPIDGKAETMIAEKRTAKDSVAMSIIALGQKAWIAEYGKGSLMESSGIENPFLQDYVSGNVKDENGNPLFNKERLAHAFAIVGRPHGYYYDLDGNRYHSHGTLKGKVIEDNGSGLYEPVAPRKIIKKVLFGDDGKGIMSELCNDIQKMFSDVLMLCLKDSMREEIILYADK